jgi:hypothetical protein
MNSLTSTPDSRIVERTLPWQDWNCMMRFYATQFEDVIECCDKTDTWQPPGSQQYRQPIPYCYLHDKDRKDVMFLLEVPNNRVEIAPSLLLLGRANTVITWKHGKVSIIKDRDGAHSWATTNDARKQILQTDIHLITKQFKVNSSL